MRWVVLWALSALLFLSGCETARATSLTTPKERVTECEQVCINVGMKLGAFVVMMNSAGCVCEPIAAPAVSAPSAGAGALSGSATIAATAAAAAAALAIQQQQQQQQRSATVH